jgi:hypothetical protein
VQRGESTVGTVAVDGRTMTFVARTRAFHLGRGSRGALHVRARPTHIEVLDEDGRHQIVRIRDVEHTVIGAIILAGAGFTLGMRALRKGRSR